MSKAREGATSARMAKRAAVGVVLAMVAAACTDTAVPTGVSPKTPTTVQRDAVARDTGRGPGRGITHAPVRPHAGFDGAPTTSTPGLMTSHGSSWMNSTTTYAIFLGTSWNTNPTFRRRQCAVAASSLSATRSVGM